MGSAPASIALANPAELARIYADAEYHGRGIGVALLETCIREARGSGAETLWLGVWEKNPRAIAFYRREGFSEVGEHTFKVGEDHQRDVIMTRPLI